MKHPSNPIMGRQPLENLFSWQPMRSTTFETLLDNQVKVFLPSSIQNCQCLFFDCFTPIPKHFVLELHFSKNPFFCNSSSPIQLALFNIHTPLIINLPKNGFYRRVRLCTKLVTQFVCNPCRFHNRIPMSLCTSVFGLK
jgi:hypothetical protein